MFHYCAYWGTWSRILGQVNGMFMEVNLTPIPCCHTSTWAEDVAPIIIRRHGTQPGYRKGDQLCRSLPHDVIFLMTQKLGGDLVLRLTKEDFLPKIDWALYKQHDRRGGGVPLDKCLKR